MLWQLFNGGKYSRAETIRGNMVFYFLISNLNHAPLERLLQLVSCVNEGDYRDKSGNNVQQKYSLNYNSLFKLSISIIYFEQSPPRNIERHLIGHIFAVPSGHTFGHICSVAFGHMFAVTFGHIFRSGS
mgnify:CR=1 FL=1